MTKTENTKPLLFGDLLFSAAEVDRATTRVRAIAALDARLDGGMKSTTALWATAVEFGMSPATLYNLQKMKEAAERRPLA